MIGLTNPNGQKQILTFFITLTRNCWCLLHSHLDLHLNAGWTRLNPYLSACSPGLTFDCQLLLHIAYLPGLTLDCQLKISLNSFNRLDHLNLLILKSLTLIQKHFLDFLFFIFFLIASHVVPNSTFSFSSLLIFLHYSFIVSILSAFLFSFIFPCFLRNAKCKCHAPNHANECHDRSSQCDMQPLYPNMSLINFEPLT